MTAATIAVMEQCATQRDKDVFPADVVAPLFVPGDRPDRVNKALDRGARSLVLDLEDAVEPNAKARAREQVVEVLGRDLRGATRVVRVNAMSERAELLRDVEALTPALELIDVIILPKTTSAEEVLQFESLINQTAATDHRPALIPTIETASGVFNASTIAAAGETVHTLLFGVADLSADLGIAPTAEGSELLAARSMVVLACAAAGIARPWDGPYLNLTDDEGLAAAANNARRLGFGAMVAIHPQQLKTVTAVFAPTPEEISWATRVVDAFAAASANGSGALRLADGTFIDRPIAQRAAGILTRAKTS